MAALLAVPCVKGAGRPERPCRHTGGGTHVRMSGLPCANVRAAGPNGLAFEESTMFDEAVARCNVMGIVIHVT